MAGQLNDSMASLESVSSTRSVKEEELEGKIRELERELKTTTSQKVSLQSQLAVLKANEGELICRSVLRLVYYGSWRRKCHLYIPGTLHIKKKI